MESLSIKEEDITEKFIRSSGSGGQKADKSSNCVYLKHLPTGIEVKCSRERKRTLNRYLARRLLAEKIEELRLGKESERRKRIEKKRRRKRRRSRRAKAKMLEEKRKQARKKELRSRIYPDE